MEGYRLKQRSVEVKNNEDVAERNWESWVKWQFFLSAPLQSHAQLLEQFNQRFRASNPMKMVSKEARKCPLANGERVFFELSLIFIESSPNFAKIADDLVATSTKPGMTTHPNNSSIYHHDMTKFRCSACVMYNKICVDL